MKDCAWRCTGEEPCLVGMGEGQCVEGVSGGPHMERTHTWLCIDWQAHKGRTSKHEGGVLERPGQPGL